VRLTYPDSYAGQGKSADDADEVEVRLVSLHPGERIVQES
jgi:hypothetical protein